MKKEQIYVGITNEQERLRAIEILKKAREEILDGSLLYCKNCRGCLLLDEKWKLRSYTNKTKITLDELEALLLPKQNVLIEVQNWIRDNEPEHSITFRYNKVDCFVRLEEHLRNDYPKGTEIIINKDEIVIR